MSGVQTLIISTCNAIGSGCRCIVPADPNSFDYFSGASDGDIPVTMGDAVQRQQALADNEQRQIEIKRDMEKMAELTQELKEYLARASQGMMSVDAIKKAEKIEKLAHSVKSKIKQSF